MEVVGAGHWLGADGRSPVEAGSYGLPVFLNGAPHILTAGHVLGGLSLAPPAMGAPVSGFGFESEPLPAYRRAVGSIAVRQPPSRPSNSQVVLDVAAVLITSYGTYSNVVAGGEVVGIRMFTYDDEEEETIDVRVHGARSGVRHGTLETASVREQIALAHLAGAPVMTYLRGCRIEPVGSRDFAADGDSGAVCVDERGRAVAMVVAADDPEPGDPAGAFAIPIWHIAQDLGFTDNDVARSIELVPEFS